MYGEMIKISNNKKMIYNLNPLKIFRAGKHSADHLHELEQLVCLNAVGSVSNLIENNTIKDAKHGCFFLFN